MEIVIKLLKKRLSNADAAMTADDRLGGNANQLNIKSMYSDIDLNADGMRQIFRCPGSAFVFCRFSR